MKSFPAYHRLNNWREKKKSKIKIIFIGVVEHLTNKDNIFFGAETEDKEQSDLIGETISTRQMHW